MFHHVWDVHFQAFSRDPVADEALRFSVHWNSLRVFRRQTFSSTLCLIWIVSAVNEFNREYLPWYACRQIHIKLYISKENWHATLHVIQSACGQITSLKISIMIKSHLKKMLYSENINIQKPTNTSIIIKSVVLTNVTGMSYKNYNNTRLSLQV